MLTKEYRIPLPLTLDEYRIAQLYMIQKKSREESEGHDSAVEILENRPYSDGPQGSGQYTYKVFHIGRHLPSWFRSIAPKTALEVHEESWNAYPYTKTKFSVPYVEKFSLEIETLFEPDNGCQDNIFQLKRADLRQREVDVIDIVCDQLSGNDYKIDEDPRRYVSQKTGRGPLSEDWVTRPPDGVIMCAYKLIKVEFRYWGLQSKVERFIHDYGLRRVMLRAHRQAWAWQDEWEGLTMGDIRRLERETQLILQKKLGRVAEDQQLEEEEEEDGAEGEREGERGRGVKREMKDGVIANHTEHHHTTTTTSAVGHHGNSSHPASSHPPSSHPPSSHPAPLNKSPSATSQGYDSIRSTLPLPMTRKGSGTLSKKMKRDRSSLHKLPMSRSHSRVEGDSDMESMYSARPEWALDSIAISDSDSELEFFDALETASGADDSEVEYEEALSEEILAAGGIRPSSSSHSLSSVEEDSSSNHVGSEPPADVVDILFLVVQGGATVESAGSVGRSLDYTTLCSNMTNIAELHFHSAVGRWALRQVPCPNLTTPAYQTLCDINPIPVALDSLVTEATIRCSPSSPSSSSSPPTTTSFPTHLPVAVMPILTTQAPGYSDTLKAVAVSANRVYQEFLQSPEGRGFTGQVCLITDCMGSVVVYDVLSSNPPSLTPSPTSPSSTRALGVPIPSPHTSSSSHHSSPVTPPPQLSRYFSEDLTTIAQQSLSGSKRKYSASLCPLPLSSEPLFPVSLSTSSTTGFDFDVTHFFSLGSPLGLVLASRQMTQCRQGVPAPPPPRPNCTAFYNLCYGHDPMSSRVEPLLDSRFSHLPPATIPVYRLHPKGLAEPSTLQGVVIRHPYLFGSSCLRPAASKPLSRKKSISAECIITVEGEGDVPVPSSQLEKVKPFSVWWSPHRLDYLVESPLATSYHDSLPAMAITDVIHSSYWEAKEVVSFILRQVLHHDSTCIVRGGEGGGREETPFIPPQSVEKWNRKRTAMKFKRLSSNHRVNDVVSLSSGPSPTLHAKFQYGPLDMVSLAKEMVDVFVLAQRGKNGSWQHLDTMATDKHGRVSYTLNEKLTPGVHPVKLLVKGDHTTAGCNVFIVPPHTEAVVFSVDGALVHNFSLSAKTMKCKPGAVEVASYWKDLGYLLVYLTGRPDMQKEYILKFLAANGFPLGVVACSESISTDPHIKTLYLARLIRETKVIIRAAYGSCRHLGVYSELGLQKDQIYILSRKASKKEPDNYQVIGGYREHVQELISQGKRPAMSNVSSLLGKDTRFALPGNQKPERRRRKSRTGSLSPRKLSPKLSHRKETSV